VSMSEKIDRLRVSGQLSAVGGGFFEPTVLTDVTTERVLTKEETFGPSPALPLQDRDRGHQDGQLPPTLTLPRSRGREGRRFPAYFYSRDICRI
jgi:hypothetical protein